MSKYYDYEDDFDYDEYDLDYDLFSHKKSDKVKWIIVFILLFVLSLGLVFSCFITVKTSQKISQQETEKSYIEEVDENLVYDLPKAMAFSSNSLLNAQNNGKSLNVKVKANVEPFDAFNDKVDFTLAWGEGAEKSALPVSDYVIVSQEEDGSLEATITCLQGFGNDKIILTVTTREGNFTGTCELSFKGNVQFLWISSGNLPLTSEEERGIYFDLKASSQYQFVVNMSNDFNCVNNYDLSVEFTGVGSLYLCDAYVDSSGGGTSYSFIDKYDLSALSYMFFEPIKIEDNVITIKTKDKDTSNYYTKAESDEYGTTMIYYDNILTPFGSYPSGWENADLVNTAKEHNYNAFLTNYFLVKVTDNVTGKIAEFKVWFGLNEEETIEMKDFYDSLENV